jgi:hypothetical protein
MAAEIKVRAERALGQIDAEANPPNRGVRREVASLGEATIPSVGSATRANWRKLGAVDAATLDNLPAGKTILRNVRVLQGKSTPRGRPCGYPEGGSDCSASRNPELCRRCLPARALRLLGAEPTRKKRRRNVRTQITNPTRQRELSASARWTARVQRRHRWPEVQGDSHERATCRAGRTRVVRTRKADRCRTRP